MEMKLSGAPEEIEKLLNAMGGSKEQFLLLNRIYKNTEPLTKEGSSKDSHVTS